MGVHARHGRGIDGSSIWVTERCGANTCIGSDVADANDMMYVADGESSPDSRDGGFLPRLGARWREWLRGIRIGNLRDGKVLYFIPEAEIAPEGVAVDAAGNVYGGEVLIGTYNKGKNQRLRKFVKR